jgi:integrase
MKGSREHRVPFLGRALESLRALQREDNNPQVFIGPRKGGLSNMVNRSCKRTGFSAETINRSLKSKV